jgi:hypothetical protein
MDSDVSDEIDACDFRGAFMLNAGFAVLQINFDFAKESGNPVRA